MSQMVEIVSEPSATKNLAESSDTQALHAHFCPNFQPIYHQVNYHLSAGKLGEYSDKSAPMIGNQAESSDKAETMELIAHPKRTLLRQERKICLASFLLKSTLLFSNESDGGNRVPTFTHEKFG